MRCSVVERWVVERQEGTVWLLDLTYARQKPWHCSPMMKLCWRQREMPPSYDHKARNEAKFPKTHFPSTHTPISKVCLLENC